MSFPFKFFIPLALGIAATQSESAQTPQGAGPVPQSTVKPHILMLRWFVADKERATRFYQNVFGMIVGPNIDGPARILLFPGASGPGLILVQSREERRMNGSFIIQVANLEETLEKARTNGARLMNTSYSQKMGGTVARSSHFADPDGNVIEALQMGGTATQKP